MIVNVIDQAIMNIESKATLFSCLALKLAIETVMGIPYHLAHNEQVFIDYERFLERELEGFDVNSHTVESYTDQSVVGEEAIKYRVNLLKKFKKEFNK